MFLHQGYQHKLGCLGFDLVNVVGAKGKEQDLVELNSTNAILQMSYNNYSFIPDLALAL